MSDYILSQDEIQELRSAHRSAKQRADAYQAYKINVIILLGTGWNPDEVSEALLLDDETIKSYYRKYKNGNFKELL
jgi:hypothetical protein